MFGENIFFKEKKNCPQKYPFSFNVLSSSCRRRSLKLISIKRDNSRIKMANEEIPCFMFLFYVLEQIKFLNVKIMQISLFHCD